MKLTKNTQVIIDDEKGFIDALYFPIDTGISDEEIEKLAQERIDTHNEVLNTPVEIVEPTVEELIDENKSIDEQIQQLQDRKDDIVETLQMGEREIFEVKKTLNTSEQDGNIEI